ncbi:hypothetical protein [Streptomyces thermodiastaticus]|jgi:hypothetical protein|uniref:hypothetical protein n=1 Tax=Streptomyces thermodiastaticus TaxID=44061 RepID=UPI00167B6CAD|nr:hypothetical protein [Streptomyces thermodiastaticus]MCE7552572.1 hypothetical protein [Streptomyces thermodiastaticus]GHF87348.1 hypothetical protein GCM10018787_40020 [Streptomyces thermodiastaticus]
METTTADATTTADDTAPTTTAGATGTPDETAGAPEAGQPGGAAEATGDGTGAPDDATPDSAADAQEDTREDTESGKPGRTGAGQGAGAVVSAALGVISLSGSWVGTVAGAREQLIGQLRTSTSASVAKQLQEVYGDAWHTTAVCGGLFALLALVVGAAVLVRPAFGTPGPAQAPWIRSVSWAGVVLGVLGLLLAVLKFTDALLPLPSA